MAEKLTSLMQDLLDCVTSRLTADGRPVCESCLISGGVTPPADNCDCACDAGQGRAWIRIRSVEYDAHLKSASAGKEVTNCPTGAWNVRLEAGVWRCITDQGTGQCSDLLTDAVAMNSDMASMVSAIACCPRLSSAAWAPETAQVIGPSGGCVAATYNFVAQLPRLT